MKRKSKKQSTKRIHNKTERGKHLRRSVEIFEVKRKISFGTIIKILMVVILGATVFSVWTTKNDLKGINESLDNIINKLNQVETEQTTLTDKQIQLQEDIKILETSKAEKKAEEERLAKEKAEAEEKAKQEEALRLAKASKPQVTSRGGTATRTSTTTTPQATGSTGSYQSYARDLCINTYGWTENDFQCLVKLWNRESGWNPNAHNKSSGAHGIPQSLPASKMASEGADYYTNGNTQIRWGLKYIKGRYGSPSKAWAHSQSKGWY